VIEKTRTTGRYSFEEASGKIERRLRALSVRLANFLKP